MGIESKYIWMNGNLVEYEKATVPFLNPTLHYGVGVFEGIRCYRSEQGPAVFRLTDHMVRFANSAKIMGIVEMPYTVEELVAAVKTVVKENQFSECYIRPLLYLTSPAIGLNLDDATANVGIAAFEWKHYLGQEALEMGIRANISSFTRHHPNVTMTKAKIAGNYVNSCLAKTDARRLGFGETIMVDPQGYVAECSGENLFVVRNNILFTTSTPTILEGITRDSVISLAKDLGYQIVETTISRDQLYIADEVFVCGTAAELVPICEIDMRRIGSGKMGPVTRKLQKDYVDAVHGKHKRSKDWLEYVK